MPGIPGASGIRAPNAHGYLIIALLPFGDVDAFVISRDGVFSPFGDVHRMVADAFKVLGNHQHVEHVRFVGLVLDNVTGDAALHFLELGVHRIVAGDARLSLLQVKAHIGVDCLESWS